MVEDMDLLRPAEAAQALGLSRLYAFEWGERALIGAA